MFLMSLKQIRVESTSGNMVEINWIPLGFMGSSFSIFYERQAYSIKTCKQARLYVGDSVIQVREELQV